MLYDSVQSLPNELRQRLIAKRDKIFEKGITDPDLVESLVDSINKDAINHSFHLEDRTKEKRRVAKNDDLPNDFLLNIEKMQIAWDFLQRQNLDVLNSRIFIQTSGFIEEAAGSLRTSIARASGASTPFPNPAKLEFLLDESLNFASQLPEHLDRALFLHLRLAYIHPFIDGNGRTLRLFTNAILGQDYYPAISIPESDRSFYIGLIDDAVKGHVSRLNESDPSKIYKISMGEKKFYEYLGARLNSGIDKILDSFDRFHTYKVEVNFNGGNDTTGKEISLAGALKRGISSMGFNISVKPKRDKNGNKYFCISGDFPKTLIECVLDKSNYSERYIIQEVSPYRV